MNSLEHIGNVDIYLLDQILKSRYAEGQTILDAGCGLGRNLKWFTTQNFDLYGVDLNEEALDFVVQIYPSVKISKTKLESLHFENEKFDHVICSAVLHFAENENHFLSMFSELIRVLKPGGSLFIRMTTDIGVADTISNNKNGVYDLKDGSSRFLIKRELLSNLMVKYNLQLIEPFKTTVVEDLRSMATIVLQKF
ncbi:class I SAM-dependent methyltransferase [Tenacibaculum sp. M341]|uniref:class I SAM-dependent methyltransferase n=1 Tax=Tenacibaculum sp. M341 TaxID=2530339 RepID=UPI001FB3337C|nr:class I SAM-dependent methyltransferase [Tenacibaculum sp. M341]